MLRYVKKILLFTILALLLISIIADHCTSSIESENSFIDQLGIPQKIKGISITRLPWALVWSGDPDYLDKELEKIRKLNIEWIQIVVNWFISTPTSADVHPIYTTSINDEWSGTLPDDLLIQAIQTIKKKGFKLMVKTQVSIDPKYEPSPGEDVWIHPNGSLRTEFFANYEDMLRHYGPILEDNDVDMWSIMNDSPLRECAQEWKTMIKVARECFSRPITMNNFLGGYPPYGLGYEDAYLRELDYLGDLDYIGLNYYPPLGKHKDPTADDVKAHLLEISNQTLRSLYDRFGKKILLTEIGYVNVDGWNEFRQEEDIDPWDIPPEKRIRDDEEQAIFFDGVFRALRELNYIEGLFIWDWELGSVSRISWSIRNRLASDVVESWFGGYPLVTCSVSEFTITQARDLIISGKIFPLLTSMTINLTFIRPDNTVVNRTVMTDSYGAYSVVYTPNMLGEWNVIASIIINNNKAISETVTFRVIGGDKTTQWLWISVIIIGIGIILAVACITSKSLRS